MDSVAPVRLVIARCSVDYEGRLSAHLPEAARLIMVKADGCVAIHADGGAYKPLNWMNAPNTLVVRRRRRGSSPTPRASAHDHAARGRPRLAPGARRRPRPAEGRRRGPPPGAASGQSPHAIEDGFTLVRREYPTAIGPIDLLCRDGNGQVVAIEVKRRGEIDGVEQLARYIERLHLDSSLGRGPRRVRRPGRQATGPGPRRVARLPLGRGRLRRPSAAWRPRTCGLF